MKNKNTELPLFVSENFEGESYSEPASTIVEKIKSVPEVSVPNGKSEANLRNKKNNRKRGRYPMFRRMSDIKPQPINWLWKDYIGLPEKITIL